MWYILNYVPPRGHRRSALPALIDAFNASLLKRGDFLHAGPKPIELFAPTFISLTEEHGHVHKIEKPLLYHYIFVKGAERDVKELCRTMEGFSFVLNRASESNSQRGDSENKPRTRSRYLTLSDEILEQFRIVAHYHSGKLPCYPLEGVNLEEGDKVQIVSGPCAGLTGTYISRKGGKSGNILVAVDAALAVVVYDVKAEYVRVLEFARDSRRVYDQLDAFAAKLTPYITSPLTKDPGAGGGVPLSLIAAATTFTSRLGSVKIPNPKLDARLQILLYAGYSILGDREGAGVALGKYESLSTHVTNPNTLSFISSILSAFPAS